MQAPTFTANKNGFEIRTEVLDMAQRQCQMEYNAKFAQWEISAKKNEDGTVTHTVAMPDFPGVEQLMAVAKQMYDFVTSGQQRPK